MEFEILGPLVVRSDAGALMLAGPRPRALLAALLLHPNEPVTAERLAIAVLSGDAAGDAVKTVRVHVSRLRKALDDPEALTTTPAGYRLRVRPDELDADRFERLAAEGRAALAGGRPRRAAAILREALSLWRGPPLADVDGLPFAAGDIARLEEARLAALELRVEADLAAGCDAELVGELAQLNSAHPQRERLYELLMLALYRSGRQTEALDAYRRARETLVAELGLEPGGRLRELERAILRQDPRLDVAVVAESPAATATSAFVGRANELAALVAGLDDAVAGRGSLLLISGEPGIGKSRLAEELAVSARARAAQVLVGRCWEAGGAPPYWPWVQALRAYASVTDAAALRAQLGSGAAELAHLVPELHRRFPGLPEVQLDGEGARFRLFEATAELLRNAAAARPTALVIDDLHAADAPSLLLLRFLARELPSSRLLVVCAYRDVDPVPGSALVETLAELAREPATRRFELGPLSEAEIAEYLALTAGELASSGLVAALHAQTDGNPLFVCETVRLLAAEGAPTELRIAVPESVRDVVRRRVSRLSGECARMLGLASVLGREFAPGPLARLCELPEDRLLDLFDEAMAARVVADVPGDGRLRFAHMVIRDTLYQQLTSARRSQLHRRALEALEAIESEVSLSELAHHALAGRDFAKGIAYARRAGDRARDLHAYEEAARLYRTALGVLAPTSDSDGPRCELLLSIGYAESRAGDTPAAKQAFLDAAAIARRRGRPHDLARAAFGYGGRNVWARAASDERLVPLLEQALAALGEDDAELRVMLLSRLAGALRDEPTRERRDRLSHEAVELARRSGSLAALAYALTARTAATIAPDTIAECLDRGREMEEVAILSGDPEQLAAAHTHQIVAQTVIGDTRGAEVRVAQALRAAYELRQPARIWIALATRIGLELLLGRLQGLDDRIEEAFAVGERSTPEMAIPAYHLQRFTLYELRGRLADIEPALRRAAAEYPSRPSLRCALAYIHAGTDRFDEARRTLSALVRDDLAALPFDADWLYAMSLLAEVCAALGDTDIAPTLYRQLQPWAGLNAASSTETLRGSASRYLALLAATLQRPDDAARHFEAALAMNERMRARPWLAYTRHDYGRMLQARDRPGDRDRARELIDAALSTYRELGMADPSPLAQRA